MKDIRSFQCDFSKRVHRVLVAAVTVTMLSGVAGVASAQNLVVSGTITSTKSVSLNTTQNGTSQINGNVILGKTNTNTISFAGVAATALDMNGNNILNVSSFNAFSLSVGHPTTTTGLLSFYTSGSASPTIIQAANAGNDNFTYTIPDVGINADFLMTKGAQTVTGAKTFSNTSTTDPMLVASNTVGGGTALSVTSGSVNIAGLTANQPVFTDGSNNLTSTGTIPAGDLPLATTGTVGAVRVDNSTIIVDGSGKITAIGAAPSGAAGGDLANTYPNPTIASNQSASTDIAASLNAHAPAAAINASAGGTGQNTYAVGDVLYANSTSSLARLPKATDNQVLTLSGGVPTWQNSGATITYSTTGVTVPSSETLAPLTDAGYIRVNNTHGGTVTVSGINNANFSNGSLVTIINVSMDPSDVVEITHQDGASPSGQQFDLPGQTPIMLGQKGAATFIYDTSGVTAYWELVSTN